MEPPSRTIVECPHCFERVFQLPDKRCPACQQNTEAPDPLDDGKVPLKVLAGRTRFPKVCLLCGSPATRKATLRILLGGENEETTERVAKGCAVALIHLFAHVMAHLVGVWSYHRPSLGDPLILDVPLCASCPASAIRHRRLDRRTVILVVHPRFKESTRP